MRRIAFQVVIALSWVSPAFAQVPTVVDFNDGRFVDGEPSDWPVNSRVSRSGPTSDPDLTVPVYDEELAGLVLSGVHLWAGSNEEPKRITVETVVRATSESSFAGLFAGHKFGPCQFPGCGNDVPYFSYVTLGGDGRLILQTHAGGAGALDSIATDLNLVNSDVVLQLQRGSSVVARAWQAETTSPVYELPLKDPRREPVFVEDGPGAIGGFGVSGNALVLKHFSVVPEPSTGKLLVAAMLFALVTNAPSALVPSPSTHACDPHVAEHLPASS